MPINRKELQAYGKLELLAKQVVEGFITGSSQKSFSWLFCRVCGAPIVQQR